MERQRPDGLRCTPMMIHGLLGPSYRVGLFQWDGVMQNAQPAGRWRSVALSLPTGILRTP